MKDPPITSLLPVLLCLTLLTSCGKQNVPDGGAEASPIAYLPEYASVPLDCDQVLGCCTVGDSTYLLHVSWGTFNASALTRVSPDGTADQIFSSDGFLDGKYRSVTPSSLQAGADGTLWVLLNCLMPVDWTEPDALLFCQLDGDGELLSIVDLTQAREEVKPRNLTKALWDSDGWLYLFDESVVHVLDGQLQFQFSLDTGSDAYASSGTPLADGRVCVHTQTPGAPGQDPVDELRVVDKEAQDWGEAYLLPGHYVALCPGSGGYLYFCSDDDTVYGWDPEAEALVPLLTSEDAGVDLGQGTLQYFAVEEDGRLLAASFTEQTRKADIVSLTPTDPSLIPEKKVLTLACSICPSPLRVYINEFNRSSLEYRVELKEYGKQGSRLTGVENMLVDIIAGNVPDLLLMDSFSPDRFGGKGLLEDLWPYIEGDPDLGRERVMEHVLDCASTDGKLWYIFDSFRIDTLAASAAAAGQRTGWTLSDLQAALEAMPEGCQPFNAGTTKETVLRLMASSGLDRYVDWTTGTVSFDSQEFRDLLSYINGLSLSPDQWSSLIDYAEYEILEGRQMLYQTSIGDFYAVQRCETVFRDAVSFPGYPRQDGSCGSSFAVYSENVPLAMTSSCAEKEGAWSFLRQLLLPQGLKYSVHDLPSYQYFPISRQDFDLILQHAMEEEEVIGLGFLVPEDAPYWGVRYTPVTQEQYDQIMELYEATESMYTYDGALWEIVSSEAVSYFAGDLPLDEAVERIQTRVQLYVNEQS